jgi:polyphosphate kinase
MVKRKQKYFNRDISWLAFNYRILEEAKDTSLPLLEQMRFLSIYASNLDEFYRVRVAEYRNAVEHGLKMPEVPNAATTLKAINETVSQHIAETSVILNNQIAPALMQRNVKLYLGEFPEREKHLAFVKQFFLDEVIPYLQPVLMSNRTMTFLRDNRPYFALKMFKRRRDGSANMSYPVYAIIKLPINDLPRFVELPEQDGLRHIMFLDDIIRLNLTELFPGFVIDGAWSIKVTRDADIGVDTDMQTDIVEIIKKNLVKRKTGMPASLYYDSAIAPDLLKYLLRKFDFHVSEKVICNRYLNLSQLIRFPATLIPDEEAPRLTPIKPYKLQSSSMFNTIKKRDCILHYPYHSFDYVIHFLNEAAIDDKVDAIKVTQYRVAHNSAVVNALITAARNGKNVTVFVELKARFDEANNLETAERMRSAGIKIIYSIPGLKVHAKIALVIRKSKDGQTKRSYAYLSTGNFNEQTARLYTDQGLFTCDKAIINDLSQFFTFLENQSQLPRLEKLLVSKVNLLPTLVELIDNEISIAKSGGDGYILMKMNGLQNRPLIDKLYEASRVGVKVDLIIRGICCLVPGEEFSRNINVIRLVDMFLEHSRIWAFGPDGLRGVFLTSSDLLNRNVKRRIEVAVPIENNRIRSEIIDILKLQLADNTKAEVLDNDLRGHRRQKLSEPIVRAQLEIYKMLSDK